MAIGPTASGTPAMSGARAMAGTRVTRATSQPPSQRPATITQKGTGESHVSGKVPERTSAPSTASPMIRQVSGRISRNSPASATSENACSAESVLTWVSHPKSRAPAHGSSTPNQRLAGRQARSV